MSGARVTGSTGPPTLHPLAALALEQCSEAARPWLARQLGELLGPGAEARLLPAYTGSRRRLGEEPVDLLEPARRLAHLDLPVTWPRADLGRAALLATALSSVPSERHAPLVHSLYVRGDNAERRALLRALPLLPEPERFLATAVEACRTNVVTVFEAIACENAYPERFFPDAAYNQLVLKALFLEVSLARVRGLAQRAQRELARMACDYASERRAAGRPVPDDIARIPGCAPAGGGAA